MVIFPINPNVVGLMFTNLANELGPHPVMGPHGNYII